MDGRVGPGEASAKPPRTAWRRPRSCYGPRVTDPRLADAYARIDALNAEDPEHVDVGGVRRPRTLVYGERMTETLAAFRPDASDALRIAVRGQHVARFRIPRSSYPEGKVGYLTWRKKLYVVHADLAGDAARAAGFDEATVERVRFIVQKKAREHDAESQTLEDCACLVFLKYEFAEFAERTEAEKMVDILRKTWGKMSEDARRTALEIPLEEREARLVRAALRGA